MKDIRFWRAEI